MIMIKYHDYNMMLVTMKTVTCMTMVIINEEVIHLNSNTIEFHSKTRDLENQM